MPKGGLQLQETIRVQTQQGTREIQLLFGDITALPLEDKVDLIMVSACYGDYAPGPRSVIGALYNMSLNVCELAKNKAEDLRSTCCCWWSQLLPDTFPYRRLLCFETSRQEQEPHRLIGEVFRALISASFVFQEGSGSVITPLLSSGYQGCSAVTMLTALVNATASWMQCGLNVQVFKIVIYSYNKLLHDCFLTLKLKWDAKVESRASTTRALGAKDLCLCYHQQDAVRVDMITRILRQHRPYLRVEHMSKIDMDAEDWMGPLRMSMEACYRVVTFLSPAFVQDPCCIELYNVALCISRLGKSGILAPVYINTIASIPTYMTMTQWVDARMKDNGDSAKLLQNLAAFVSTVPATGTKQANAEMLLASSELSAVVTSASRPIYDVFISYCHKDTIVAEKFLRKLEETNPSIKIFFDKNELKTGTSWQGVLYDAIQSSSLVIAFLSSAYVQSAMCQEELALSAARHCSANSAMHLMPLLLEDMNYPLAKSGFLGNPVPAFVSNINGLLQEVCMVVSRFLSGGFVDGTLLKMPKKSLDCASTFEAYRHRLAELVLFPSEELRLKAGSNALNSHNSNKSQELSFDLRFVASDVKPCSLLIISCDADASAHSHLHAALERQDGDFRNVVITVHPRRQNGGDPRYTSLDSVDCIVALVSPSLINSDADREELVIAMSRQRKMAGRRLLYPVLTTGLLPDCPLYLELLNYLASATDTHSLNGSSENKAHLPIESLVSFWCRLVKGTVLLSQSQPEQLSLEADCLGGVLLNVAAVKMWLGSNQTASRTVQDVLGSSHMASLALQDVAGSSQTASRAVQDVADSSQTARAVQDVAGSSQTARALQDVTGSSQTASRAVQDVAGSSQTASRAVQDVADSSQTASLAVQNVAGTAFVDHEFKPDIIAEDLQSDHPSFYVGSDFGDSAARYAGVMKVQESVSPVAMTQPTANRGQHKTTACIVI